MWYDCSMPTDSENKETSTSTTYLLTSPNSIKTARVFRIGDDGKESFLGEKDAEWSYDASQDKQEKLSLRFYCPAHDDDTGDYCKALLFPRRNKSGNGENQHYSYSFSTRPKQIHNHEIESRKYNISPIVRYNCYSFLNRILKSKKNKEKKDSSVEVLPTFDLPVKELPQTQPKTVVDYYIQTRTCDPDELMPKSEFTYGECLVNSYSIQEFRSGETDFGRPILVVAGKTNPAISSALFGENVVVLSDPFTLPAGKDDTHRLHFILRCDSEKFEAMCNATERGSGLSIILCKWKKSELRRINLEDGRSVDCRVVVGHIEKPSAQIRQLKRNLFNYYEYYEKDDFIHASNQPTP